MDEFVNNLNQLGKKDVSQVYEMLQQIGKRGIIEKQPKTEQKAENCFIKEPENAIQFALETSNWSNGEKWKGKSTLEVHKKFINELQNLYPEHNNEIQKVYNTYEINKSLSKIIPNIEQVFVEAAKNKDRQLIFKINQSIGSLSEAILRKNIKPVMNYFKLIEDKNSYNNLKLMFEIKKMISKGEIELDSEKINFINQKLSEAGKRFPQLSKQIKMYVCEMVVDFNGSLQDFTNKTIVNIQNNNPKTVEKAIDEISKIYKESLKLDPHNLTLSRKYAMLMDIVKSSIDKIDTIKMPEYKNSKNMIYKEYGNALLNTMIISPSTANTNKIKEIDITLSQKSDLKKDIKKFSSGITESKSEKDIVPGKIKSREMWRNRD
jgi:hypothetical protein